jgi:hypothetical protein
MQIRTILKKSAFTFIAGLVAVLLLEAAVRVFGPEELDIYHRYYFKADKELGFDIDANRPPVLTRQADGYTYHIWSNEIGCFDEPLGRPGDSILLLGDSFTWDFTRFEDKWGTLLQKHLGMRVLRCGVSGFGTRQSSGLSV